MEDSYNRVLIARHTIPEKFYVYFMNFLAKTVSCYLQKLYTKKCWIFKTELVIF